MKRTATEKRANDFDRELYGLLMRAEQYATKDGGAASRRERSQWAETYALLRQARAPVRSLMHIADTRATY